MITKWYKKMWKKVQFWHCLPKHIWNFFVNGPICSIKPKNCKLFVEMSDVFFFVKCRIFRNTNSKLQFGIWNFDEDRGKFSNYDVWSAVK